MKKRIGIFETNSSSTHSCVISDKCKLYDTITPDDRGQITIEYGEYGWEQESYRDPYSKACYALTLTQYQSRKEVGLGMLKELLVEHTGATEVVFKEQSSEWHPKGYVDHQSVDDMIEEIFASKESLKSFIFNPNSSFETDNDNH